MDTRQPLPAFIFMTKKDSLNIEESLKQKTYVRICPTKKTDGGALAITLQDSYSLGFGVDFSNAYSVGVTADDSTERLLTPEAYTFRIGRVWTDSLEKTGKEPNRAMRVEYYPDSSGLAEIKKATAQISSTGLPNFLGSTKPRKRFLKAFQKSIQTS